MFLLLVGVAAGRAAAAASFAPPQVPLFLVPAINPNILIMLDTSQSMDATMGGKVISGLDPGTRSNVARTVLRDILDSYRYNFNWGLGSFEVRPASNPLQPMFAYYLGNASTMVYTNTCTDIVDGVGVSDVLGYRAVVRDGVKTDEFGKLPCIPNPEPGITGAPAYITFSRSGDDPDVNDIYYWLYSGPHMYGIGASGTNYYVRTKRVTTDWASWGRPDFRYDTDGTIDPSPRSFTYTDSGWLPKADEFPRQVWLRRALGFTRRITGKGQINESVVSSQPRTAAEITAENNHFTQLKTLLAPEEMSTADTSLMLKNSAQHTPLAGSLLTSFNYFSGTYSLGGTTHPSPIVQACQRNYVVLATDGNPTGKTDGTVYTLAETTNTRDPVTGLYTFGTAARDVFTQIDALRTLSYGSRTYDVRTYVVGLGDTVVNPGSVAALNEMARRGGTGSAYLASSGDALKTAFESIVATIGKGEGAAASVALSSQSYRGDTLVYQAKFNPATWTGNLLALPVDASGVVGGAPVWQAATQLAGQDWNSGRTILTFKPSSATGIAFRAAADESSPTALELDPDQIDELNTDPMTGDSDGLGALRLAFLRGDTTYEARNRNPRASFRDRLLDTDGTPVSNVLGDIVDSTPFYVGAPSGDYRTSPEAGSYSAFAATWASRTPYIYVGGNDGMLHAFDAKTGSEKFAYVPNLVFPKLAALTPRTFSHQFTVDGSPMVGDAFYDGAWHSLLVSGLRGGGRGLFALDVTDPAKFTESQAASVVRWEVGGGALGYVYARPMIAKTNDGNWSVITGNGYGSDSGTAQLLVLDARTGAVRQRIDTGIGGGLGGNGLSGVVAVDVDSNGTADFVYAGDLQGNLWKFDLSNSSPSSWNISAGTGRRPLFAAGSTKPITAAPDVTRHPNGGFMIVFGTGRYMATLDVSDSRGQSLYGIWDKDDTEVTTAMLQQQKIESDVARGDDGSSYRFSTHRVGPATDNVLADDLIGAVTRNAFFAEKRGWTIDLPSTGERSVADAAIRGGRAVFSSTIPSQDICLPGGTGWIIEVDVLTGNRRDSPIFDTNGDLRLTASDYLKVNSSATGTNVASGWGISALPSQAMVMSFRSETRDFDQRIVNTSKATTETKAGPGRPGTRQRVMWQTVE